VPDRFGPCIAREDSVLAFSQDGAAIREVAEEMGVSAASIHRILKVVTAHTRCDSCFEAQCCGFAAQLGASRKNFCEFVLRRSILLRGFVPLGLSLVDSPALVLTWIFEFSAGFGVAQSDCVV
jgi:8-oxo-dGTP pyrophosphatase MutT (NUDIX family)